MLLVATMILPPLPARLFASSSPEPETSTLSRPAPAHTVAVIGDSLSIGLGKEMERVFASRQDVAFTRLGKVSSGLAKPEFFDWEKNAARMASSLEPDVVVIMIGANDNKNILTEDGRTIYFTDPGWDAAYAARASLLVDACRAHKPQARIFWIGTPVMADATLARDVKRINAALAGMCASKDGCTFIDTWNILADGEGRFATMAVQPTGEPSAIRLDDGVHITPAGSRLLASRCLESILPAMNIDASVSVSVYADAASLRPVASREVAQAAAPKAEGQTVAAADAPGRHTVRAGESLWTIAKRAGTSVAAVVAVNPGLNPNRLSEGAVIALPVPAETVEVQTIIEEMTPAAAEPGVVKTEATPVEVAVASETVISGVQTTEPTVSPATASNEKTAPVETAAVEPQSPAPTAIGEIPGMETLAEAYVVQPGDSVWTVAKKLGVSPRLLVRANTGIDPDRLSLGQRLAVPVKPVLAEAPKTDTPTLSAPAGGKGHILAQGDNFWTVARRLGVRVSDLRAANPGLDPRKLQPGQTVTIPDAPATSETAANPSSDGGYAVADGDNLWKIARRFGVSVTALKKANAGVRPDRLQPGQRLAIPEPAPVEQAAATSPIPGQAVQGSDGVTSYAVAGGDTPWTVAKRFGVDVDTLMAANTGINPKRLQIGQLLTIPATSTPDVAKGRDQRQDAEAVRVPVAKGDNLWSMARRYGLRVDDLMAVNKGIDPQRLEIGSELVIPSREAAKAERERRDASVEVSVREEGSVRAYTISDGDTLWNLSKRFGVSVERILDANTGMNPDRLEIGQPLNIPASVMAARF